MIPPTSASPEDKLFVVDKFIVYESTPIFAIAVWVAFISVSGTPLIWYSSTISPSLKAVASESPTPLVKLDTVVPDIVPDTISVLFGGVLNPTVNLLPVFILKVTVPELGKFVDDASVKLVDDVVIAPLNVVSI